MSESTTTPDVRVATCPACGHQNECKVSVSVPGQENEPSDHADFYACARCGRPFTTESGNFKPGADKKADIRQKKSKPLPRDSGPLLRLARRIRSEPTRSRMAVALDFTEQDVKRAESLLRKLRRYRHLID
jgi:hypothetical protein